MARIRRARDGSISVERPFSSPDAEGAARVPVSRPTPPPQQAPAPPEPPRPKPHPPAQGREEREPLPPIILLEPLDGTVEGAPRIQSPVDIPFDVDLPPRWIDTRPDWQESDMDAERGVRLPRETQDPRGSRAILELLKDPWASRDILGIQNPYTRDAIRVLINMVGPEMTSDLRFRGGDRAIGITEARWPGFTEHAGGYFVGNEGPWAEVFGRDLVDNEITILPSNLSHGRGAETVIHEFGHLLDEQLQALDSKTAGDIYNEVLKEYEEEQRKLADTPRAQRPYSSTNITEYIAEKFKEYFLRDFMSDDSTPEMGWIDLDPRKVAQQLTGVGKIKGTRSASETLYRLLLGQGVQDTDTRPR